MQKQGIQETKPRSILQRYWWLFLVLLFAGVDSISMDMKDKKLTVTGDIDPVTVVAKLRKICHTEIVTVGPAKEPEKKKEEPKKEEPKKGGDDKKKDEAAKLPQIVYPNYYQQYPHVHHPTPYMQHQNYYRSAEEDPNSCVIC